MYPNNVQHKYKQLEHNIHRTAEGTTTRHLHDTSVITALVKMQIKIPVFTLAGLVQVNNNGTPFHKINIPILQQSFQSTSEASIVAIRLGREEPKTK
jgi:hypothetical protein